MKALKCILICALVVFTVQQNQISRDKTQLCADSAFRHTALLILLSCKMLLAFLTKFILTTEGLL